MNIRSHITQIAENDCQLAFQELYLHFSSGMISYANTLLRNLPLAEEVVNDVFVRIWTNRKTLTTVKNITHYLYVSVKHTSLNYIKSQKKNSFVDLEAAADILSIQSPESGWIQKENLKHIEATINALPDRCRLVFRLIKETGLKYNEVAELLSISPKTVGAHMTMAYSYIAEHLKSIYPKHNAISKNASGY